MTDTEINILTIRKYYLVLSTVTHKPYIDRHYACYLFESFSSAEEFVKKLGCPVIIQPERNFKKKDVSEDFYSLGIRSINVFQSGKEKINISITENDLIPTKETLYNNTTNGDVLRLSQTKEKKYLRNLKSARFFAPILIKKREDKQYPNIRYCYAMLGDSYKYFVLFSSLLEFNKWNETQGNKWAPIEVNLLKFGRIRKNNPVILNPLCEKILLTHPHIKIALG